MTTSITITGFRELDAALASIGNQEVADRIAKSALGAALTVAARSIKKAAPKGKTKNLVNSIGKRFEKKKRSGVVTAKVGVNVGKNKKDGSNKRGNHGQLVALGTSTRQRKAIGGRFGYLKNPSLQQLSTGIGPANDFVKRGYAAASGTMNTAMKKAANKAFNREADKAARKGF